MKWIPLEVIKYMAQFSEDFMFQYQITSCDRADMFALGTHIIINLFDCWLCQLSSKYLRKIHTLAAVWIVDFDIWILYFWYVIL